MKIKIYKHKWSYDIFAFFLFLYLRWSLDTMPVKIKIIAKRIQNLVVNQNSKISRQKCVKKRVSLNSNLKYKQKKLSLPTSMTKTNIWPHIFVLIFLIVTACSGNCIDKVLNKIRYNRVQTIWRKNKEDLSCCWKSLNVSFDEYFSMLFSLFYIFVSLSLR